MLSLYICILKGNLFIDFNCKFQNGRLPTISQKNVHKKTTKYYNLKFLLFINMLYRSTAGATWANTPQDNKYAVSRLLSKFLQ